MSAGKHYDKNYLECVREKRLKKNTVLQFQDLNQFEQIFK